MSQLDTGRKEARTYNTGLAKVTVQCSADTFPAKSGQVLVNQILVLRINICGKNRHFRQAVYSDFIRPPIPEV